MRAKKTKFAALFSAAIIVSSLCAVLPVSAADTGDTPWSFSVSNSYSYTAARPKDDDSYVYVKVNYSNRTNGAEIQTMGRPSGGSWVNRTSAGVVYLKQGHQYSVENYIYEALDDEAALRGNAPTGTTLNASGVWSPDSVGSYEIV